MLMLKIMAVKIKINMIIIVNEMVIMVSKIIIIVVVMMLGDVYDDNPSVSSLINKDGLSFLCKPFEK